MVDCEYCEGLGDCSAEDDGYICTRPADHDGDHVACGVDHELHRWPKDDGDVAFVKHLGSLARQVDDNVTAAADSLRRSLSTSLFGQWRTRTLADEPDWPLPTDAERAEAAAFLPGRATGHVTAWRWFELGWRDDKPVLRSVTFASHAWPVGAPAVGYDYVGSAVGFGHLGAIPPGIYAYRTRERAIEEHGWCAPRFLAEVALWGTVVEHEHGYRARYAYPLKLYHQDFEPVDVFVADELGKRYGVPVERVEAFVPKAPQTTNILENGSLPSNASWSIGYTLAQHGYPVSTPTGTRDTEEDEKKQWRQVTLKNALTKSGGPFWYDRQGHLHAAGDGHEPEEDDDA